MTIPKSYFPRRASRAGSFSLRILPLRHDSKPHFAPARFARRGDSLKVVAFVTRSASQNSSPGDGGAWKFEFEIKKESSAVPAKFKFFQEVLGFAEI